MMEKTFRPAEVEAKYYARWEQSGAFAAHVDSPARPYVIMIPPPNVTGSLHMGHALTFTLQDILIRYHRMRGFDTLWQPGTDHAGIATQAVVERQLAAQGIVLDRPSAAKAGGANVKTIGREAFIEKVWEWKAQSGGTITRQLRRLGASLDWSRERFTMDEGLSHAVRKVFVDLYKKGLIYRDQRLVNWDPKLHTAISDLEVQNPEVKGHLWHIRYPIKGEPDRHVIIATTRPETMLADTAVAVHPDDERYRDLVGKVVVLPLVGREIPIIADSYADPETGSGAVKITPAHDFNDFEVGRRHDLPRINIFDKSAYLNENAPSPYRGLDRDAARKRVVADLEAQGLIEKIEPHTHKVPHGDRGNVPIEPWLTDQWYVDAKTLAEPAIKAVEEGRTRFVPELWAKTYFEWMRNIEPWCISRQIWWGHQIPAWYGPDGTIFVEMSEEEALAAAAKHYGKAVPLRRDEDVLDTWFSSGLWPFSTLGWPEQTPELARYYPGDVLVTGFDIIFFWVARMMMLGMHFMGDVPFHTVYIHALVRDERGQKMSKFKGNILDPLDLIGEYGCDALRFTLASQATPGRDIKFSETRVESNRNFATKLWNATRYCLLNGCAIDARFDPNSCTQKVNRWIIGRVIDTARQVETALRDYRFNDAASALYHFTWGEFCDWYIEFTKPILTGADETAKTETRGAAAWTLSHLLHLLHPIMPFLTEELYEQVGGSGQMLITSSWPSYDRVQVDATAAAEMDWVIRVISEIRGVRAEMNVPPAAKLTMLMRDASPDSRARLQTHLELIRRLARLDHVAVDGATPPNGAVQLVIDEATIMLPLADIIDVGKERARLARDIDKLRGEAGKIESKLANAQFVAKAPPDVIEEQRDRLAELQQTVVKLTTARDRLSAV
jgi:valyl-tRNA synthetase